MIMKNLQNNSETGRGGYGLPGLSIFEVASEKGFATSDPTWNDGSISDTPGNYNTWEKL